MGPWRHCCISGDNEATRNRMRLHCHSDNHAMTVTGKLVIQIFTVRYSRVKDKGIFTPNLRNLGNIPLCRAISTGGFGGVASDFREKVSGAHLNQWVQNNEHPTLETQLKRPLHIYYLGILVLGITSDGEVGQRQTTWHNHLTKDAGKSRGGICDVVDNLYRLSGSLKKIWFWCRRGKWLTSRVTNFNLKLLNQSFKHKQRTSPTGDERINH